MTTRLPPFCCNLGIELSYQNLNNSIEIQYIYRFVNRRKGER